MTDLSLVAAVRFGLPDVAVSTPVAVASAETVMQACSHRVEGLLYRAIDGGCLHADETVTELALHAHLAALRTCLKVEQAAVLAFDALRAGGVDVRVLKGVALARLDYGEPQDRIFGDVDLLIRREDHQAALAALCGGGFARALPPVRLGWERRFSKALMMIAPNGSELDLHMALAGGYFGARFDHESMWRRVGATFELAGRTMTALDEADRLIHACLHGELGGGSGMRVRRDIAQLALASGLAWEDARNRAAQSGCDVVVAAGISNTWQMLDLDESHPCAVWASAYVGSARQQEMLSLYHRGSPSEWAPEARSTLAALGRIDQARFIAGLTFPSRSSLAARQRTPVSHVRQAIRSIASRRVPAE